MRDTDSAQKKKTAGKAQSCCLFRTEDQLSVHIFEYFSPQEKKKNILLEKISLTKQAS